MAGIKDSFWNDAYRMHQENIVVDAHLDLAGEIYLRHRAGETEVIKNHYLTNFKEAGLTILVSSVFVSTIDLPVNGLLQAMNQISALLIDLESVKDEVTLIKCKKDFDDVIEQDKIGIILYMEGLDPIGMEKNLLWAFYEMGVRGASLTWSRRNYLAEGCCNASKLEDIKGGITKLGKETIKLMEKLCMFLDISHLNDEGFAELMEFAEKSFIATHSNSRSIHMNYRNLTDEQITQLAGQGGIMGLNAYKDIVGADPYQDPIPKMCDHVEYIINLVGDSHVGYGFDLCDSYELAAPRLDFELKRGDCLLNHSEMLDITAELLRRGVPNETVRKIIGGNFASYFRKMLPA